ncbi:MAG: hypothetical protein IH858_10435 [Chloroflexi bacterium]|nr:hypothetical protein [Chloroflexota bacterium]MCH8339237.1 hypothetical protein [Chloroflexota bacterium]
MSGVLKVARRTLIWVFAMGGILLSFSALNPFSSTALVMRLLMLILAVILAAGLFPNSYLHRFAVSSLDQRPERGSRLMVMISVFGPLVFLVISASAIAANLDNLQLINQLGVEFIDPRSAVYTIIQYSLLGFVSLVFLIWNLVDLIRARGAAQAA